MAKKKAAKQKSGKASGAKKSASAADDLEIVDSPLASLPAVSADVARIAAPRKPVSSEFDVTSDAVVDRGRYMQSFLSDLAARRRTNPRPSYMQSAASVKHNTLPFSHFSRQWFADVYGYPETGVIQVIGDTGCGKSTLVISDMGHIMHARNAQSLYLACEGSDKMMTPDRMLRCLHHDPKVAIKLLQSMQVEVIHSVLQLMPKIKQWADAQREGFTIPGTRKTVPPLPMNIPLLVAADPFSRLLSPKESEGHLLEWDKLDRESVQEFGEGGNMGHAKFAHDFVRKLQNLCDSRGILLFVVHHRTEDIDFGSHKSDYNVPAWKKRLLSYEYLGGNAFDGLASTSIVMTSTETVVDRLHPDKPLTGKRVRARMCKQSHGAGERFLQWELRTRHVVDRPDFLEPAIDYAEGFVRMLADQKKLGVSINDQGLVRVADLNLSGLTFKQVDLILHSKPELLSKLGHDMRISGYYNLVDEILQGTANDVVNAKAAAAPGDT